MRKVICLLVTAGLCAPAHAYFDRGTALYATCQSNTPYEIAACLSTIIGHYDMMMAMGYRCGDDSEKNKQQIRDVVVKYMRENPASRSETAASLSFVAIFTSFSCTSPEPVTVKK